MSEGSEFTWRYPAALIGTALAALCVFLGVLGVLQRTGNLPPPALTNSLCVDEKLAFLRDHGDRQGTPSVLAIGSSVAWRHFDGAAVEQMHPGARALNAGFCGLPMHQSAFVTRWLTGRLGSAREVVALVAPQDFADCSTSPAALFDAEDTGDFLDRRGPPLFYFYLRYFDPFSLARNARNIAAQRSGRSEFFDTLVMDRWGDGPLDTDGVRSDLVYGPLEHLDPACFAALHDLSRWLAERHSRLIVATTPLHPEWRHRFDPDGALLEAFDAGLRQAVGNGEVWAGHRLAVPDATAFTDAIHLRWSAAQDFTRTLVQQTALGSWGGGAAAGDPPGSRSDRHNRHRLPGMAWVGEGAAPSPGPR